ncbi:unnamed protein product [Moneuplotes crassus]|uniref:Cyclic nucleotide-binding domain-containing protein n=1 Tax=Euplotes crassus TaxID=5936 RepID=A0AAD1U6P9_EUPCR|nr:unnamed protein product [Moneuplotes crassus]
MHKTKNGSKINVISNLTDIQKHFQNCGVSNEDLIISCQDKQEDGKLDIHSLQEMVTFLQNCSFLNKLSTRNIIKIGQRFQPRSYSRGNIVLHQGAKALGAYVVIQGDFQLLKKVRIYRGCYDTRFGPISKMPEIIDTIKVSSLGEREVFGVLDSLKKPYKALYTVECISSEGKLLFLDLQTIDSLTNLSHRKIVEGAEIKEKMFRKRIKIQKKQKEEEILNAANLESDRKKQINFRFSHQYELDATEDEEELEKLWEAYKMKEHQEFLSNNGISLPEIVQGSKKVEPLWTIDWLHKTINQEGKALKTKRSPGILSLLNKGNHKRSVSLVLNLKTKHTDTTKKKHKISLCKMERHNTNSMKIIKKTDKKPPCRPPPTKSIKQLTQECSNYTKNKVSFRKDIERYKNHYNRLGPDYFINKKNSELAHATSRNIQKACSGEDLSINASSVNIPKSSKNLCLHSLSGLSSSEKHIEQLKSLKSLNFLTSPQSSKNINFSFISTQETDQNLHHTVEKEPSPKLKPKLPTLKEKIRNINIPKCDFLTKTIENEQKKAGSRKQKCFISVQDMSQGIF